MKKLLPDTEYHTHSAEWIKISPAGIYECSDCKGHIKTDDISEYRYCHHCGTKIKYREGNTKLKYQEV